MNPAGQTTPRRSFPVHIIVFLAPAFIIYTLFMIYPLIDSLRLSLYTLDESRNEVYVGLDNYEKLTTEDLWSERLEGALKNNFRFFLVHMFVQNPIGLLLASLLASQFIRFRTVYRTLIFTPTVLSVVLIGFVWKMILNPIWGISAEAVDWINTTILPPFNSLLVPPLDAVIIPGVNALVLPVLNAVDIFGWYHLADIRIIGELQIENKPWLGLPDTALTTLALVSVWQWVGIPMMLFLAALIGIPDELIEAARVDGATAWGVWRRIKMPLIMPTVGVVGILTFVGNFNAFDLIYTTQKAAAGPAPYATDIMGTFFYRTFFGIQLTPGNPTMGATIAGVMFFIILTGVLIYMFGWQRRMAQIEL